MSKHDCPNCGKKVFWAKLLIMGPCKTYKCASCSEDITVDPNTNRIIVYSGLVVFGLFILYSVTSPGYESIIVALGAILVPAIETLYLQKVIRAKI
jgi:DNA-directed RNA polymerase subunit RPC12/RpoP